MANNTKSDLEWGVYEFDESVHVIPELSPNVVMSPHVFEPSCPCHPDVEDDYLIIHNMIH